MPKTTKQISIRSYLPSDNSIVHEKTEEFYFNKFNSYSKHTIRIIISNDDIVGWMMLSIPKNFVYDGQVFIYVFPEHRRQRIGSLAYRQAESKLLSAGCNWWTSYPSSDIADKFIMSVGFDHTNTNFYMEHDDKLYAASEEGIRMCCSNDYPEATDIWSNEYANMHTRIGTPYEKQELTEEMRKEEKDAFLENIHNAFVLEIDGRIVGFGQLFDDNSGIGAVAVDRNFVGHGYGTRLSAFLTNESIRRGCKSPCLYCELGNDDAMHIYKKIGYREVSCETVAIRKIINPGLSK